MFLLLLIAPKQKNFCVTKDRVPLRGLAVKAGPRIVLIESHPPPIDVPPAPCGRAPRGGFKRETAPSAETVQQKGPF